MLKQSLESSWKDHLQAWLFPHVTAERGLNVTVTRVLIVLIILGLFIWVWNERMSQKSQLSFPPGPKGFPLVGNVMDLPPKGTPEFQHWLKHKDTYGPMSSITIMGQTLVFIHDQDVALDLFKSKSKQTSGRPNLVFAHKLCGFDQLLASLPFGAEFRRQRRLIHQQLGSKEAAARYNDTVEVEVHGFMLRLLDQPEKLLTHLRTQASSIILKITYGYAIEWDRTDPLVKLIDQMMVNLSQAFVPMRWIVDIVPSMRRLPDWFPGTAFKQTARRWRQITQAVADIPHAFVRQQMAEQKHRPSYVSRQLEYHEDQDSTNEHGLSQDDENAIKWTAAVMYAGGADTTVSGLSSFILAMILFPNVQTKAQNEIDHVIGRSRLPGLEDRSKLPYVEAIVSETLRWLPVAPMGLAHQADEDFQHDGYTIPKGAILMPAVWWFLHDPSRYHEPERFDPDRHLEPRNEPDPRHVAFGFGRRICPGRYLAESNLFLTIAMMLAGFRIGKAIDEAGSEIEARLELEPGLIFRPSDFPFRLEQRSEEYAELVRDATADGRKGDADLLPKMNGLLNS